MKYKSTLPTFMWHLPEGRLGGGRARVVSHPRAQQGSCCVQRRRRRLPAPRCRSARRVIRNAVTFGDAATSARTKVQAQPTAADRATAASAAAAGPAAATSGHANTVLKSFRMVSVKFPLVFRLFFLGPTDSLTTHASTIRTGELALPRRLRARLIVSVFIRGNERVGWTIYNSLARWDRYNYTLLNTVKIKADKITVRRCSANELIRRVHFVHAGPR